MHVIERGVTIDPAALARRRRDPPVERLAELRHHERRFDRRTGYGGIDGGEVDHDRGGRQATRILPALTRTALPPMRTHEIVIDMDDHDIRASGVLFALDAVTLHEQRATRRATMSKRAEKAAHIASGDEPCIVWCELNDEADACEAAIDGAIQINKSNNIDKKIRKLALFASGGARVLVTKPSVCGFGLNWQHCNRMVFAGASHSYEQTYQAVRRCWRFGQKRPVDVYVIRANTERAVIENYRRKEADAARLGAEMAAHVMDSVRAEVVGASAREWNAYKPSVKMTVPAWAGKDV